MIVKTQRIRVVFCAFAAVFLFLNIAIAADKGADNENTDKVADAKAKAKERLEKVQDDVKKADPKSLEDVRKLASDQVSKGRDELGKKLEKMKEKNTAENKDEPSENQGNAKGQSDDNPGKHLAKGQSDENPGKHLGQEKKEEAAAVDSDTEAVNSEGLTEAQQMLRRRELGYSMHRRYLDTNEAHMKMMKEISEKKGLKVQEQRKHIKRVARLERMRELSEDVNDTKTIEKIDALLEKEIKRHEQAIVNLHNKAKKGE